MKKVLILGSCASRDAFEFQGNHAKLSISAYYARSSLACLSSPPTSSDKIVNQIASPFQKRMVKNDMEKLLLDHIKKIEFDTILIDLIDERFDLLETPSGSILTLSNEYLSADKNPAGRKIKSGSAEHIRLWENGFNKLFRILEETNSQEKIIVNKLWWAKKTNLGNPINGFPEGKISYNNNTLQELYSILEKKLTSRLFINHPKDEIESDENHKWGISPFHYTTATYNKIIQELNTEPAYADIKDGLKNAFLEKTAQQSCPLQCSDSAKQRLFQSVLNLNPGKVFRLVIGGDYLDLIQNGFAARKGLAKIKITSAINWASPDRNLEFNLNAWRMLNPTWAHYIKNQDKPTAEEIFEINIKIIKDWHEYIQKKKVKHAWYDMAVGIRSIHLAFMQYIILRHRIEPQEEQSDMLREISKSHEIWLLSQDNITSGNHAIYQITGLATLFLINQKPYPVKYIEKNLTNLIALAFDGNYVSSENSPFYHKYNIDILSRIPTEILPSELEEKVHSVLANAKKITKWLTAPNGEFYRIGDTEGDGEKLTSKDVALEGYSTTEKTICKDLGSSGYQIVRSHPDQPVEKSYALVFRGAASSLVHAHCDALSFILHCGGDEIFSDPGKYTYEYGEDRKWFISDASHNTAGIRGVNFSPEQVDKNSTEITPIKIIDHNYILSGRTLKGAKLNHSRTIIINDHDSITILDEIINPTDTPSEIRLFLGPEITILGATLKDSNGRAYEIEITGDLLEIKYFSPEESNGWISKEYGKKTKTGSIIINVKPGITQTKTKISLPLL